VVERRVDPTTNAKAVWPFPQCAVQAPPRADRIAGGNSTTHLPSEPAGKPDRATVSSEAGPQASTPALGTAGIEGEGANGFEGI
jgi:hypothetical protein